VVIATHDVDLAGRFPAQALYLEGGRLTAGAAPGAGV
jgi:ABC-type ATPase involved in cell division